METYKPHSNTNHTIKTCLLFALLCVLPLHAALLGDAIDASKGAAVQEQTLETTGGKPRAVHSAGSVPLFRI